MIFCVGQRSCIKLVQVGENLRTRQSSMFRDARTYLCTPPSGSILGFLYYLLPFLGSSQDQQMGMYMYMYSPPPHPSILGFPSIPFLIPGLAPGLYVRMYSHVYVSPLPLVQLSWDSLVSLPFLGLSEDQQMDNMCMYTPVPSILGFPSTPQGFIYKTLSGGEVQSL